MQLRKRTWMLGALGALGLMLTACGNSGPELACSMDRDCLESELCHPDEKLCVPVCTTSADCPPEAKSCEALNDAVKICRCLSDCEDETSP